MGSDRETIKHAFIYSSVAILSKMIGFIHEQPVGPLVNRGRSLTTGIEA